MSHISLYHLYATKVLLEKEVKLKSRIVKQLVNKQKTTNETVSIMYEKDITVLTNELDEVYYKRLSEKQNIQLKES